MESCLGKTHIPPGDFQLDALFALPLDWTPESFSPFLRKQVHESCQEFLATCGKRCMVENESSEADQTVKAYWAGEVKDFLGEHVR